MDGATPPGGPAPVAYFSEALPEARDAVTLRLAAAVVWRGVPAPGALAGGGGGPLGWLRGARHRLWLRLGPLGADVSVAGRPLFGGAARSPRGVSSAGLPQRDEPLAYYDDGSRTLRVLGRVLPAPAPGRTLVALVDASGQHAAAPRLVLRVVPTLVVAFRRPGLTPPPATAADQFFFVSDHPDWTAALRADPVVRAFLDRPGAD